MFGAGTIRVTFISDPSNTRPGFTINVFPLPEIHQLQSMQPFALNQQQQGGFVYFQLPRQTLGRLFYVDVEVFSYSGLREPGLFISVNRLPSLEHYDYTNTTVLKDTTYQALFGLQNPPNGQFVIGVFLYGTAAKLTVTASWTYNIPQLSSGVQVTNSVGSSPVYYQVLVPLNSARLTLQISRQVPGGYPTVYIAQGTVPSPNNYQWIMATSDQQSYISLPINNPNPIGNTSPNPGNYIISLYSRDGNNAGFIFRADWS
jgi:hypothetical protein